MKSKIGDNMHQFCLPHVSIWDSDGEGCQIEFTETRAARTPTSYFKATSNLPPMGVYMLRAIMLLFAGTSESEKLNFGEMSSALAWAMMRTKRCRFRLKLGKPNIVDSRRS